MKPRVLWIEDGARLELASLCGPIYFSGKYEFTLAEDVTTAVNFLRAKEFQAVIVDIRLPPGIDPTWHKLYQLAGSDKVQAQLGLKLLEWLLSKNKLPYDSPTRTSWVDPTRIGVFTVESEREIKQHLEDLGIRIFKQKEAGLPDTILLQLIEEVLAQSAPVPSNNGNAGP